MPGGLLQLASSGLEDTYLTKNPEITFFKKIYRRYTNFSLEIKDISLDHSPTYGEEFTITLGNFGDLLNKSFLEVNLPIIKINDSIITNQEYIDKKTLELNNLKTKIDNFKLLYNNLKEFSDMEIDIYRYSNNLLLSENISVINFKTIISNYSNQKYLDSRDDLLLKLDNDIVDSINILKYIINISDTDNNINIKNNIQKKYDILLENLNYYFSMTNYYQIKYDQILSGEINYCWDENIGHNFFESFEIEIGGISIEKYSNDRLHIYQTHNIDDNRMENYLNMIGNNDELKLFYNKKINEYKLYIPLIFWFCKEPINSLPLVAMRYSEVIIKIKISPLKNILFFKHLEQFYKNFLILDVPLDKKNFITTNLKLNYNNIKIIPNIRMARFYCKNINNEFLKIKYPNMSETDRNILLSYSTSSVITNIDFYNIARNINNNNLNKFKYELFGKLYYLDYEYLYSYVSYPQIKFLGEFIFLDEVERYKFCSKKLEYMIDIFQENKFNLTNSMMFIGQLDFSKPAKELLWFIKPLGLVSGYDIYDSKNLLNYKINYNNFVKSFNIYISNLEMFYNNNSFNDNYYKYVTPYQYLNNETVEGVYYKSFSLHPENIQPSGSINFKYLKGKTIRIEFLKQYIDYYYNILNNFQQIDMQLVFFTKNYSILSIQKGQTFTIF